MGLSQYGFALLLARQKTGAGLGRVLCLGRQRGAMGLANAAQLARSRHIPWHEDRIVPSSTWGDSAILAAGASSVDSMDFSTYESCSIVHDLNKPVPDQLAGAFDTIFDGGTLEHVYDFPAAIKNCLRMLKPGGIFLAETPSNNWMGHGFYQFSPELFYRIFTPGLGGRVLAMAVLREGLRDQLFVVDDPASVGSRLRHNVRGRTSLLVMAQKVEEHSTSTGSDPQQSDYQTLWRKVSDGGTAGAAATPGRWRRITRLLPHGALRGLDNLRTDWERHKNRHQGLRRLGGVGELIDHCSIGASVPFEPKGPSPS